MEKINTVIGFFQAGGIFMYPIVVILAIGTAIAIERYVYLSVVRARNRKESCRCWKTASMTMRGSSSFARMPP